MSEDLQLQSADIPLNQFNQFVVDNVHHNLVTLDCLHIPWDACYCICCTGLVHSQEIPMQSCENG